MTPYLTRLPAFVLAAALASPAWAQDAPPGDTEIVVTAQAQNATVIKNGGSAGVLGDKPAEDLPFSIRSYDESLILNQQPQTLGEVLDNDPTIRTTYGYGNAAEQFVIRGFPLYGDDVGLNGLYGIAPRQLIAPELFESVQVLNGATAFVNGAAPGGSGLGGSVNLLLKRAGDEPLTRATLGYTGSEHFGGSFDIARRFGSNGAWGLRINGAYRDGEVSIAGEDRRTLVLGGGLDFRGERLRASLDLGYQEVRVDHLRPKVTLATAAIPAVPKADANYAQNFTFTRLRDVFGTANVEFDLTDNILLYARGGARDGSENGIYGGITVNDAANGDGTGNALIVPRTDNNEAVETGLRAKFGSAVTNEINIGGNASWQVNRNAYDFRYGPGFAGFATNLYDPVQVALPSSSLVGGDLDDPFPISRTRLMSAFASDTLGFWNERVLLTVGGRLQAIRAKSYSYADGSLDAALALPNAREWDIAAAHLIIEEAGGLLTGFDGRPPRYNRAGTRHGGLLAAPPRRHRALLAALDAEHSSRCGQTTGSQQLLVWRFTGGEHKQVPSTVEIQTEPHALAQWMQSSGQPVGWRRGRVRVCNVARRADRVDRTTRAAPAVVDRHVDRNGAGGTPR